MKEVEALYVGVDDSNHADRNKKSEIIAATFSTIREDSIVKSFGNRRNRDNLYTWLDHPEIDFRFLMLSSERYRHFGDNVFQALPRLVTKYLIQKGVQPKELKLYLDGTLGKGGRPALRSEFEGKWGIEKVVVDNFIKKGKTLKGRTRKGMRCPLVVYYADVLAHDLYPLPFQELLEDERCIGAF